MTTNAPISVGNSKNPYPQLAQENDHGVGPNRQMHGAGKQYQRDSRAHSHCH